MNITMRWTEFMNQYQTHDCSFEMIEFDTQQEQCKLYLDVQTKDLTKGIKDEDYMIKGYLEASGVCKFSIDPSIEFANQKFDGEILSLSVNAYDLSDKYIEISLGFLIFDYVAHSHTFHMLVMVAQHLVWHTPPKDQQKFN